MSSSIFNVSMKDDGVEHKCGTSGYSHKEACLNGLKLHLSRL